MSPERPVTRGRAPWRSRRGSPPATLAGHQPSSSPQPLIFGVTAGGRPPSKSFGDGPCGKSGGVSMCARPRALGIREGKRRVQVESPSKLRRLFCCVHLRERGVNMRLFRESPRRWFHSRAPRRMCARFSFYRYPVAFCRISAWRLGRIGSLRARSLRTPHMLRAPVLLFVLANSAIAFIPTSPRLVRPHLAAHKPNAQAARPCPRVEGARMQSGDGWQAFKSGDTWRNNFGEIGPTRYDTYLSTYRSSLPRVEGTRMQSGGGWQAFKSGDTWRNIFGEIGPTRYDTYLSTYRSSRRSTSKPTTRSSRRKSKSSSSGSSSNWFSSYDSGYSFDGGLFDGGSFDGGSFGGGSFDGGGGFSDGGGGFSDGGGGGGADF